MWCFLYDSLTNFAKYKIIHYALICNFSMHTFPGSNSLEFRGIQPGAWMKSYNNFDQIQLHKKSKKFIHNMMDKYITSNEARNFDIPAWQWWQTNKRGVWFKLSPPSITWTGVTKVRYRARAIDQMELFCT